MLPVSLDKYAEVKGASTSLCIRILINITKCLLYLELFYENTNLCYSIISPLKTLLFQGILLHCLWNFVPVSHADNCTIVRYV